MLYELLQLRLVLVAPDREELEYPLSQHLSVPSRTRLQKSLPG
jgi:hypothetical protein